MISEERITKNVEKFKETNEKYGIFSKELEEFLGEDFYLSPASASLDMYGCYPGGLLNHLMKVCKYSLQINDLLPERLRANRNSLIRVVFLSQIGKTFLYKPNQNEWFVKNKGKLYEYRNEELVDMTVGERSAFYATKYGVKLTDEEFQAIVNSDKEGNDRSIRWQSEILCHVMKLGFEMSLMEEKHGKKRGQQTTD